MKGKSRGKRQTGLEEKLLAMKSFEEAFYTDDVEYLGGVDEVGRGPLAGPVVAACVVLPRDFSLLGVDDSKKISQARRILLAEAIKEHALAYGLGLVGQEIIDQINIAKATKKAMTQAISLADQRLKQRCGRSISFLLIDGRPVDITEYSQQAIVKGDEKSLSIAAASILAKVARDQIMMDYAKDYPQYDFENNKGYGTQRHYEGLDAYGPCTIHRHSFLKKWYQSKGETFD